MKLGIDIHGVIDADSEMFSRLTNKLIETGKEVHIITGASVTDELVKQLDDWGINFTFLFSITDYHKSIGTKITYDKRNRPWMDVDIWNKAKAEYCKKENIYLMIDDSEIYGKYFTTPYLRFTR